MQTLRNHTSRQTVEMPVIDIHNHFFPRGWPDLAARFGTPNWPWIKHTEPGKAEIMVGDRFFRHIYSACWDPDVRLEEMDRDGVETQVISATPVLFAYERPAEHALECARLFNDAALELCSRGKGRLKSFCQVPLQDVDASCKELSRCLRAGHLGVQIGNHVGEKNLDDAGIVTFLHHCADEGAAVLVHPWDMLGQARMPKYMMPWTVGMPAETQLGIVALILSGALDKLPKNPAHLLRAWWRKLRIPARSFGERLGASSCRTWKLRTKAQTIFGTLLRRFGGFRSARVALPRRDDGNGAGHAGIRLSISAGRARHWLADSWQPVVRGTEDSSFWVGMRARFWA